MDEHLKVTEQLAAAFNKADAEANKPKIDTPKLIEYTPADLISGKPEVVANIKSGKAIVKVSENAGGPGGYWVNS